MYKNNLVWGRKIEQANISVEEKIGRDGRKRGEGKGGRRGGVCVKSGPSLAPDAGEELEHRAQTCPLTRQKQSLFSNVNFKHGLQFSVF